MTLLAAAGAALALAGNAWADAVVGLGDTTLAVETSAVTEVVDAAGDAVPLPAVDMPAPDVPGVAIVVDPPVADRPSPPLATSSSEPEATLLPPPATTEPGIAAPARRDEHPITLELAPAAPIEDATASTASPRASAPEPVLASTTHTAPPSGPPGERTARDAPAGASATVIALAAPPQHAPALPPEAASMPPPTFADGAQPLPFVPRDTGSSLLGSVASSALGAPVVAALFLLAFALFLPRLGRILASTAAKVRAPELSLLLERPG